MNNLKDEYLIMDIIQIDKIRYDDILNKVYNFARNSTSSIQLYNDRNASKAFQDIILVKVV